MTIRTHSVTTALALAAAFLVAASAALRQRAASTSDGRGLLRRLYRNHQYSLGTALGPVIDT